MKKKIVLMMLCMTVSASVFTACGAKQEQVVEEQTVVEENSTEKEETSVEEDAAPEETVAEEPVDEAVDAKPDYLAFVGEYQDSFSQRAIATVTENEDQDSAHIVVNWSSSADEETQWEMNVTYDGEKLNYTDAVMRNFDYKGASIVVDEVYTNGSGYFVWQDGTMLWTGAADENCKNCVFERIPQDVITAETSNVEGTNTTENLEAPDAYFDTVDCMAEIYDVQAGTAGSSSRLGPAKDDFIAYVINYGSKLTSSQVADIANEWFDLMLSDDQYIRENFSECLEAVVEEAINDNVVWETDPAFMTIVEGMRAAISN